MKKIMFSLVCVMACQSGWAFNQAGHRNGPIIGQYFGVEAATEQIWQEKFRDDTPFDKFNRLYITDTKIVKTHDGHFTIAFNGDDQHVNALLARVRSVNPDAEIFISLNGDGSNDSYRGAVYDLKFAENVASFLRQYNLTGLDVDWKLSLSQKDLTALLKKLHDTLHPAGYLLTLDAWQFVSPQYDVPVIKDYLDQINVMSYGTGISLEVCTGDYIRAGFSANQIIGSIETESNFRRYGGVTDTLGATGTIIKKVAYAKKSGIAGVTSWRLDNDYAGKTNANRPEYKGALELWDAMNKN